VIPYALKEHLTMKKISIGRVLRLSDGGTRKALQKEIHIIGVFGGENSRLKFTMKK
jgi:hypothetical protein